MIELRNISLVFGKGTPDSITALSNINLKLDKGDFVTVIGSNGAGKSSLLNVISGINKPSSGTIYKDSQNISNWPEYKCSSFIGRVFQNPLMGTAGNMNIQDNLTIASYKGMKKLKISLNKAKKSMFRELLASLNMELEDRMTDNVDQLSGGQRQALTMLMAVLSSPDLLLLDEHTAALDPRNVQKVLELTQNFYEKYNLTVIMVTHNMVTAINQGNRLIMMDKGEIILERSGEEKSQLTVPALIDHFHKIRHDEFNSDETLLV